MHTNMPSENNMFGQTKKTDEMVKKLVDKLLIPLTQQKWDVLNENHVLLNSRMKTHFKDDELYTNFLKSLDVMLKYRPKEEDAELVFVLPPIQLKAEYEIHKLLFGDNYEKEKLDRIRQLLKKEMSFEKIKNLLT